jgi:hypothetical protein
VTSASTSGTKPKVLPDGGEKTLGLSALNPSTLLNYTALWRRYIEPELGKKRLTAITKQNCSELLRKIARENPELSRRTLQRIKAFMTALFNHAAEKWEMPPNPASGKLEKIGTTEVRKIVP